jgi:hypothetical protein
MAEYNGARKTWPPRKKASTYASDRISLCSAVRGGLGPVLSDAARRTFPRPPRLLLRAGRVAYVYQQESEGTAAKHDVLSDLHSPFHIM